MTSCKRVSCPCKCYKKPSSKWNQNKCNSCNHSQKEHGIQQPSANVVTQHHPNHAAMPTNDDFSVGDKLEVLYENKWWGAQIININQQQIQITYDEWDEYSNEWINKNSKRLKRNMDIVINVNRETRSSSVAAIRQKWVNSTNSNNQCTKPAKLQQSSANVVTHHHPNHTAIVRDTRSSSVAALRQKLINSANSNNNNCAKPAKIINNSLSTGDCGLCAVSNISNIITLTKCKHKLCKNCMNSYIKITSTDKLNITCPFCSIPCDRYQDVKRALSHQEFYDIYLRPNLKQCLSANCTNTIKLIGSGAARLDCPKCGKSWCVNCNVPWHDNMDCDTYKKTEKYIKSEEQFQKFKQENREYIKQCPKCNVDIEKNGGCNHMTCKSCHTHFCWKCCNFYADTGDAVYQHMSSCQ